MQTLELEKRTGINFPKKKLALAFLPMEHSAMECDDVKFDSCVEEEPPAWHEAVVEARYQAWKEGKETSKPLEVVFQELRDELGF